MISAAREMANGHESTPVGPILCSQDHPTSANGDLMPIKDLYPLCSDFICAEVECIDVDELAHFRDGNMADGPDSITTAPILCSHGPQEVGGRIAPVANPFPPCDGHLCADLDCIDVDETVHGRDGSMANVPESTPAAPILCSHGRPKTVNGDIIPIENPYPPCNGFLCREVGCVDVEKTVRARDGNTA